jgi:seryl-tRNA synthetase
MLDPKFIRENSEKVKQNAIERSVNGKIIDQWLEIDSKRSALQQQIQVLNQRKNEIAESLKDAAKRTPEIINEGKELKAKLEPITEELKVIEAESMKLIVQIPNMHFDDVPRGKDDSENVEIKKWGEIPALNFLIKDHFRIAQDLDLIDFEAGAKVAGSQFYFLKNDAVRLEYALIQFGLDLFRKKGFDLIMTPDLAKSRYYLGTGYVPRGDEAQIYEVKDDDLGLIATAEITMAGYLSDEVVDHKDLPLKFAAISHCFRREAGAYGKYSKGLYRVHQFTKLEMFSYCRPEDSDKIHQEFLAIEEEIVQALNIPYRVLAMCTGDLGAMAAKKYDIEAWMPGRGQYGEITSTSNCTDFQARNLNIKFKNANGEHEYLHMLNGTAVVLSRFPVAIMENYQQADGTIKIPEVLRPYMGGQEYIGK